MELETEQTLVDAALFIPLSLLLACSLPRYIYRLSETESEQLLFLVRLRNLERRQVTLGWINHAAIMLRSHR